MQKAITLTSSITTLYSELFQQVMTAESTRTLGNLNGVFANKIIKNQKYWYLQYSEAGKQKQVYLGVENPSLLQTIKQFQQQKQEIKQDKETRQRLCAMLMRGGMQTVDATMARIIRLLSESGVFRLGGILVGSHAFITYGGMLGVCWPQVIRTQDIDVAQTKNVALALAEDAKIKSLPDTLEQAKMGFHPVPSFNYKQPSTSFKMRGKEIHLDLLTPMIGPETEDPVYLKTLNSCAQPLRFLDYLIEESTPAVILHDEGILVNVPLPARYAFHKLIVSQKRNLTNHIKSKKDLEQACLLFDILLKDRMGDVLLAWDAIKQRGKKWTALIKTGLKGLQDIDKDTATLLKKIVA